MGNLPVNDDLPWIVFGFVPHGPLGGLGFKRVFESFADGLGFTPATRGALGLAATAPTASGLVAPHTREAPAGSGRDG